MAPRPPPYHTCHHDGQQLLYGDGVRSEFRGPEVLKLRPTRPRAAPQAAGGICEQVYVRRGVGWFRQHGDPVPLLQEPVPPGQVGTEGGVEPHERLTPRCRPFEQVEHASEEGSARAYHLAGMLQFPDWGAKFTDAARLLPTPLLGGVATHCCIASSYSVYRSAEYAISSRARHVPPKMQSTPY